MLFFIYLFLFGASALILYVVLSVKFDVGLGGLHLPAEDSRKRKTDLWNLLFVLSYFLIERFHLRERIYRRLAVGNVKFKPEEFFSIKLILMLTFTVFAFFVFLAKPLPVVIALVLGYFIPELWLETKIRKRKQAIIRLLPETVDLLSLCVEAGLEFSSAIDWIIKKASMSTPMIEELTLVLEEIKWGKPRSQALKDMSARLNLAGVTSFAQTLIQGERMGTPIVESFNILSENIRLERFHRGERKALQAPIKMLVPLIFCILPVIAIIIGGPILIQFTKGDLFKGF